MVKLPPDFKELLNLFNDHQVEYLLIGGYAVAIHGFPRYTGDIDIWVSTSDENAEKIVEVLKAFGFDHPNLSKRMFLNKDSMTRMGREPLKVEILNSISGIEFEDAKPRCIQVDVSGISVPVICLSDLRKNKAASGRAKDLADLENLPLPEDNN